MALSFLFLEEDHEFLESEVEGADRTRRWAVLFKHSLEIASISAQTGIGILLTRFEISSYPLIKSFEAIVLTLLVTAEYFEATVYLLKEIVVRFTMFILSAVNSLLLGLCSTDNSLKRILRQLYSPFPSSIPLLLSSRFVFLPVGSQSNCLRELLFR